MQEKIQDFAWEDDLKYQLKYILLYKFKIKYAVYINIYLFIINTLSANKSNHSYTC